MDPPLRRLSRVSQLPSGELLMTAASLRLLPDTEPGIGYDRVPASTRKPAPRRPHLAPVPSHHAKRSNVSQTSSSEPAAKCLEELIKQYGHVIRAAVRKAGGTHLSRLGSDAEDVVQSVLLEVWKQVRRQQDIQYPSSYLYRAAVRETVRLMERTRSRKEDQLGSGILGIVTTGDGRDGGLELRQAIDSGLGALLPDRRKAVERHLAGYRVAEIMQRYDWSYSRARNLIARGMADLRDRLRALGVER